MSLLIMASEHAAQSGGPYPQVPKTMLVGIAVSIGTFALARFAHEQMNQPVVGTVQTSILYLFNALHHVHVHPKWRHQSYW